MAVSGGRAEKRPRTPLGVHTSIAGGVELSIERAVELGCTAMQIFSRNPRSWGYGPIPGGVAASFREKRQGAGISAVAVHTSYLINLCSPSDELFERSVALFSNELASARALGADFLVTHLGSPGAGTADFAVARVLDALRSSAHARDDGGVEILLENTSGAGSGFGADIVDIGRVINGARKMGLRAGLCFDTCHAFAAGYAMRTKKDVSALVRAIDTAIGLERLGLIHLNDSKGEPGGHLDRHEHIGDGKIGSRSLSLFLNHPEIKGIPVILETPKKSADDDPRNLATVKALIRDI